MPASPSPRRARRPPILAVVLGALLLTGAGAAGYVAARESSLFALRKIEVRGATPDVAGAVRGALAPLVGESLVTFDQRAAHLRLAGISEIADFELDRAFPHTLRVSVRQEREVAVVRRGADAWLVAASGRVLRPLDRRAYPGLPRIWVPLRADVEVNATLPEPQSRGVQALAPLGAKGLPVGIRAVRAGDGELTLVLVDGRELRLGSVGDAGLKLAIARRILPLTADAAYVDVSVPERPVAGYNPQVAG